MTPAIALAAYSAAVAVTRGPLQWALASALLAAPLAWRILASPNAWVTAFFMCLLLTPPIPAEFGGAGVHPAMAIAAVGVWIGLLRIREWRFERSAAAGALALVAGILFASAGPAILYSGAEIGLQSLARAGLFAISVYVFLYVSAGPGHGGAISLNLLYGAALIAAAFACVDFYFQFPTPAGYEQQFVWLESGIYRRAQGLFYEAITLGNFCAFFLVMAAVAMVYHARGRFLFLAGGAVFAAALIFSSSRAAIVNLAVALVTLAVLERRRFRLWRLAIWTLGAIAAVALMVYRAFPEFAESYLLRWSNAASTVLFSTGERSLSDRFESWRTLLGFLMDHPWHALIGVGYKTLPYSDFAGHPVVPDNMYLSMLVETGVVGLVALVALNVVILRAGYRAARSGDPQRSFYGAWIFCFWMGESVQMFSGDLLTYWRVLPVYFWVLAMAVRE
jgi:O-antigen ligase